MRATLVLGVLLLVSAAVPARAETPSVSLQGGGGITALDTGHHFSGAVGVSPWSRVTFIVGAERTHLDARVNTSPGPRGEYVTSAFRGGTMTAVSGSVLLRLFPEGRLTPYVVAGIGRGVSRPNVNAMFPTPVTNDARFALAGAGVEVPIGKRLGVFADARMMVGAEGVDGLLVVAPVRVGASWRF